MRKPWRTVVGLLGLLLVAAAGLEINARFPPSFVVTPIDPPADARVLVLLLHGSGGREEPALIGLEQRFTRLAAGRTDVAVMRYIWSPHSDARLRARVNGRRVGEALGRAIAARPGLRVVHLVGHSAGAYPVQAFCEAYRSAAPIPARIVTTFLDPIGFDGAFNPRWGAGVLGHCADYAEAIINTDDPVPATNSPLTQAWNVDVTAARGDQPIDGHRWPVDFYAAQLDVPDIEAAGYNHATRPRGGVVVR